MSTHQMKEAPHFIINPSADAETQQLLSDIEAGINESPALYLAAFETCIAALDENMSDAVRAQALYLKSVPSDSDRFPNAFDHWLKFMKQRADRNFEFDSLTEEATRTKGGEIDLLLEAREKPDADKERVRNRIRYKRMTFYMGRVAARSAQQSTEISDDEEVVA